ncbi:MAG: hypothetical protein ACJ8AW_10165 [Rhodopila sp.]
MNDHDTRCSQDDSAASAASGSEETRVFMRLPTIDNKSLKNAQ